MADYVNSHGGLAGCRMQLVYHDDKWLAADGADGESQTECEDFAHDQHAFAVLPASTESGVVVSCDAANHVVTVPISPVMTFRGTAADYRRYRGYLYGPFQADPLRLAPEMSWLASAGYFGAGAKVGILLADDGTGINQKLVNNYWKPALAKMGISPVVFTFRPASNSSDIGSTESQWSSATLQFKAAGVDHLILTPDGGQTALLYPASADQQGFHPRWALDSYSGIAQFAGSTTPASEQKGAIGTSFWTFDLSTNTNQTSLVGSLPVSRHRQICEQVYRGKLTQASRMLMYMWCDSVLFLQDALAGASAVTVANLLKGVERLGTSQAMASNYTSARFGPAHYDGANAVRMLAYDTAAKNWKFASPPVPMP